MNKSIIATIITFFAGALAAFSLTAERQAVLRDSLRSQLAKVNTAADSVQILYDLFDIARYDNRLNVAEELYSVATRTGSLTTEFDVMRRLGALYGSSSADASRIKQLINQAASMPISDDQRITLAFLRIQSNVIDLWKNSPDERQKTVREMIMENSNKSTRDPYDEIEFLFTICRYLQDDLAGNMVTAYLNKLAQLLSDLPGDNLPLESQYYTQASLIYTTAGLQEEAVAASKKLLETIAKMDKQAKDQGHRFRDYDLYRYIAYRRLLTNYQALTDEEIDAYYDEVNKIAQRNTDIQNDINNSQRVQIYYLMGKKKYAEALEILKKQVDNPVNQQYLSRLYPFMMEAAQAVGDNASLIKASQGYIAELKKIINGYAGEHRTELTLIDEVRAISGSNADLLVQQREASLENHRIMLRIVSVSAIIFLIVILIVFFMYLRGRRLTYRLRQSNDELILERDAMQNTQKELIEARDHARRADRHKAEFINNMSHEIRTPLNTLVECSHLIVDNTPEEKQHYLKRYADMIDVSADMLNAIVSDVLEIAALDTQQVQLQRSPEPADKICRIAVDSMKKHAQPGVVMEFVKPFDEELNVNSDPRRVEQVLINLLSNGAKFTEKGFVRLSYSINPAEKTITFSVTDSGIGVPKGKEEVIFERFEKLSNLTSGTGLGLNISRMIATLLGGTIVVDTSYEGPGARFLFTIPLG